MAVWMDSINDSDLIPTWKNAVIAKVTRISMEDEDDDDDDFHAPAAAPAPVPVPVPSNPRAPPSHQSSMASQGSSEHLDIFDGPAPVSSTPAPAATGNLFDTHAAAPASGGSLLDMNDNYGRQAQPAASTAHADFLGMTATAAPQGQLRPLTCTKLSSNVLLNNSNQIHSTIFRTNNRHLVVLVHHGNLNLFS
jgi:hypothetical protein